MGWAVLGALAALPAWGQGGNPDPRDALQGQALVEALRGGGYTLFFRHAIRDIAKSESTDKIDFADCATQVPLADVGRTQSQAIGEAFRKLRIPIGESYASDFCRTMDTARLIAGRVTAERGVRGEGGKGFTGETFNWLARIVATPPPRGTNRIVVGHVSGFEALGGSPYLQEAEAAVFRPGAEGTRVLVARLRAEDWKALASPANALPIAQRSSAADPQVGLRGQGLLNALRAGGYAIYFRHGLTDTTQQDRQRFDASDCASQRNLSAAGRQQVAKIGAALQAMRLPLGEILASPYCRTMETARLVAGTPVALEAIRGKASAAGGAPDYSELESLLAKPVGGPALRILVGHGNGFAAAAGDPHLEEGEAAVLRAVEGGGWIVIARVQPGDWDALAALAR